MVNTATVCQEWSGRLQKKEYRDWLSVGHALSIMCEGIRPYISRTINIFYSNLCTTLASKTCCHCIYVPARKRCPWHDLSNCAWANELVKFHRAHKPRWQQSDSTKWTDPNAGPWEIAKLFMSDLGSQSASVVDANTTDPTGLLNLIYWCNAFKVSQVLIKEVRETRNSKWAHLPQQELSIGDKKDAFKAIRDLLQDPELVVDPDAQSALADITSVETTELLNFEEIEFKVIKDSLDSSNDKIDELLHRIKDFELASFMYSNEIMNAILDTKEQIRQFVKKSEERTTDYDLATNNGQESCKLNKILNILEEYALKIEEGASQTDTKLNDRCGRPSRLIALNSLWKRWTLFMCLLCCFSLLHKEEINNSGCEMDTFDSQTELQLREFRFGNFLKFARKDFVGRQWLFRRLEGILESNTSTSGVLIIGEPGSGKSALISELICSKSSSALIHSRILGFHFCSYFDKGTQNAAKFVRNLASMIAVKIKHYRYIISSDPFIQKLLHKDCFQDPVGCFEQSILTPLNELEHNISHEWYVVVDALDECITRKSLKADNIISLLQSKLLLFPKWLRLILTSRRESAVTKYLRAVHVVELQADDPLNREDITAFINQKLSVSHHIVSLLKNLLRLQVHEHKPSENITRALAEKSQGNFLYIKMLLYSINNVGDNLNTLFLPPSLSSTYQTFFERQYPNGKNFRFVRRILEVLIVSFQPLSSHELFSIIGLEEKDLHFKYDFLPKLKELSVFLRESEDEGVITVYHSSLAEWLTSKENEGELYYVDKERGHSLLAKYYLMQSRSSLDFFNADSLFHFATHISEGGLNSESLKLFLSLPSEVVNKSDSGTKETALHISAASGVANVTSILEKHFFQVDIEDNEGRTPAFLAAAHGNLKILDILFKRGANLNHTSAPLDRDYLLYSDDPSEECKRTMCEYSLLHAAAQGGHTDVVQYLLDKKVNYDKKTRINFSALHLAAEKGHTKTVEMLSRYGIKPDFFALYQASASGYVDVVKLIILSGVNDKCVETEYGREYFGDPINSTNFHDEEQIYETALTSAIRHTHNNVVKVLLKETVNTMNCINYGFDPLHVAVIFNNVEATRLLLSAGVNTNTRCKINKRLRFRFDHQQPLSCRCGYSALHWAAELQHYEIAVELIQFGIYAGARDCKGSTALHIASCRGNMHFIHLLVKSDNSLINGRTNNGSTPLHSAATCHASGVFETLLQLGSDPNLTDYEGMSVFFYILKEVNFLPKVYFLDSYVQKPWQSLKFDFSEGSMLNQVMESYSWYQSLVTMALKLDSSGLKILAKTNKAGFSIFAFAGRRGLDNASLLLTEKLNNTQDIDDLYIASLTPLYIIVDISARLYAEHVFREKYLPVGAISPPTLTKLISKFILYLVSKNCSDLTVPFSIRSPYMAALLLESGADVNCPTIEMEKRPLFHYLHSGGRHLSKLLVQYNVDINVECGKRLEFSPSHLTAYHKLHYLNYLSLFYPGEQWEDYIISKDALFDYFFYEYKEKEEKGKTIIKATGDGPTIKAIKKHPEGIKIINECLDEDGYTLLHRAAQGANVAAIKKLLALGANVSKTTWRGANALALSVRYAVKTRPLNLINTKTQNVLVSLEIEFASFAASTLLDHIALRQQLDIRCEEDGVDITLYHLAASRGMWRFIKKLLRSTQVVGINVKCTNKHGLTPWYLAMLYGGNNHDWENPWCKVIRVIKEHGGDIHHPTLETEYNLIFFYLFNRLPTKFDLDLTQHEIWSLRADCGVEECKNYKGKETDYLNLSDNLDLILHYELEREVDKNIHNKGIKRMLKLAFAEPVLRLFSSTFFSRHASFYRLRSQILNFFESYRLELRNVFEKLFTDETVCAPRGHLSSYSHKKIKVCDNGKNRREMDIHSALKAIYEAFKRVLDVLTAHSKEAKKYVSSYDDQRELSDVYHLLNKYEAELLCDYQSITKKYVHLKFLLHSLENWKLGLQSTAAASRVPQFIVNRIKKMLTEEPSEAVLNFILEMASKKPPTDFTYLKKLGNLKPPL